MDLIEARPTVSTSGDAFHSSQNNFNDVQEDESPELSKRVVSLQVGLVPTVQPALAPPASHAEEDNDNDDENHSRRGVKAANKAQDFKNDPLGMYFDDPDKEAMGGQQKGDKVTQLFTFMDD